MLEEFICEAKHTKGLNGLWLHPISAASRSLFGALVKEEGRYTQASKGEAEGRGPAVSPASQIEKRGKKKAKEVKKEKKGKRAT